MSNRVTDEFLAGSIRELPTYPYPNEKDLAKQKTALDIQIGGGHYKDLKIQPVEYIHANNLPFIEGCIVKYISRWRTKNGIADLRKAQHFIELLIQLEELND